MPNVVKKYKTLNYSGSKSREYSYGNSQYSKLTLAQVEALQLQTLLFLHIALISEPDYQSRNYHLLTDCIFARDIPVEDKVPI